MKYFAIIFIILMSVSTVYSTPMNSEECTTWECTETTETAERERTETREVTTYRQEEIQETRYVWHENEVYEVEVEKTESSKNERSNVDRFWFDDGSCRISHVQSDHQADHILWSNNSSVTVSYDNGVTTYDIGDVDECNRIRELTDRNNRENNDSSSSDSYVDMWSDGWWEVLTISNWIEVPETTYFTDTWTEEYEIITIICIPIYDCDPIPEPATMLLFGTGLFIGAITMKKTKLKVN